GRAVAAATATSFRGKAPAVTSFYGRTESRNVPNGWLSGCSPFPAAGIYTTHFVGMNLMVGDRVPTTPSIAYCSKPEGEESETYHIRCSWQVIFFLKAAASGFSAKLTPEQVSQISIYMLKEQDVYAAEIAEIMSRFERKGFKLVAVKLVVPNKELFEKHYHDPKERPFFSGLVTSLALDLCLPWSGKAKEL
ncbi:hypothetical protein IFM89_002328, partial [Coptis chinensis]